MLVLKSIWHVSRQILFGLAGSILILVGFIVGCFAIGFCLHWINVVLATIIGASAWSAFLAGAKNVAIYVLGGVALLGIIALFALEVRDEYLKEKKAAERREEGWE